MDLTPANRAHIDSLDIYGLLSRWRFAPAGDLWFQGETGAYWQKRMTELRSQDNDAWVAASKDMGW